MSARKFVKHDAGKPALELLPFRALVVVGDVLRYGSLKYEPGNWKRGAAWSRYLGAALRHVFAWASGESNDIETGLSHLAHAVCCLLFLMEYELRGIGTDDRDASGD